MKTAAFFAISVTLLSCSGPQGLKHGDRQPPGQICYLALDRETVRQAILDSNAAGRQGENHVRLKHNTYRADCAYPGVRGP